MDFSMKNNKIVNHFSNFKERSTITPMEVLADGTQANENPAACYRGLGCVSGNNSSRLLLDYKVEHPHAYEEIMRLLFQKDYGHTSSWNWEQMSIPPPAQSPAPSVP